tara:strand:+ start:2563 stop:2781 length:219 start_codon:yes stop_codon:yes gene_type:complete
MDEKFELTQEQIAFIKQKLAVDTLENVNIIIELGSKYTKDVQEQFTNKSNKFAFTMGLCPPDYIKWLPTCLE